MMGPEDFRRIALSLPEAVEVYRRGASLFRVERKTFASLEGPGDAVATILTPDQQSMFMDAAPKAFQSVAGGWGRFGSTKVNLASVTHALLQSALGTAWHNVAPKPLLQRVDE
jgi:hypothetical protein